MKIVSRLIGINNQQQRFRFFVVGVVGFFVALALIYLGVDGSENSTAVWQLRFGTVLLAVSLFLSIYCYLSMLVARLIKFWQE